MAEKRKRGRPRRDRLLPPPAALAGEQARRERGSGKSVLDIVAKVHEKAVVREVGWNGGDPWERQEGETDTSFLYFTHYRDLGLGNRSLSAVAKHFQKSYDTMTGASFRHNWKERAALWDRELDRIRRAATVKAIDEMTKRHINLALMQQKVGAQELVKLDNESAKDPQKRILEPEQINRLLNEGVKSERLARGEPDSINEQRHELNAGEKRGKLRLLVEDEEMGAVIERMSDRILDSYVDGGKLEEVSRRPKPDAPASKESP